MRGIITINIEVDGVVADEFIGRIIVVELDEELAIVGPGVRDGGLAGGGLEDDLPIASRDDDVVLEEEDITGVQDGLHGVGFDDFGGLDVVGEAGAVDGVEDDDAILAALEFEGGGSAHGSGEAGDACKGIIGVRENTRV